jgi:hypothetical protein
MRRRRRGRSRRRSGAKTRQQAALPCLEVAVKYGEVWIREKLSTAVAQQNGRIACKLRRKGHGRKGRNQPSVRRTPTHALNQIQSSGYYESLSTPGSPSSCNCGKHGDHYKVLSTILRASPSRACCTASRPSFLDLP